MIGRRLCQVLDDVVVTSRNPTRAQQQLQVPAVQWDASAKRWSPHAPEDVDAVVHLAGEPVLGRWTPAKKERIRASRVDGTATLLEGLQALPRLPRVLVSASAVGIYGDGGDRVLDESSTKGEDFLAEVCAAWEDAAQQAEALGVRVVRLRIGLVLAPDGGALKQMLPAFRLGVGGPMGNGRQYMPWVHIDDIVGMVRWAIANDEVQGAFNACAPDPVTNAAFSKTLAKVVSRPSWLPVPKFALKTVLGEMSDAVLVSQRVVPKATQEAGYVFEHDDLEPALRATLRGH